jgi:hypothetical protein
VPASDALRDRAVQDDAIASGSNPSRMAAARRRIGAFAPRKALLGAHQALVQLLDALHELVHLLLRFLAEALVVALGAFDFLLMLADLPVQVADLTVARREWWSRAARSPRPSRRCAAWFSLPVPRTSAGTAAAP